MPPRTSSRITPFNTSSSVQVRLGARLIDITGRNPQRRVITNTPLAAGATYTSPFYDLTTLVPHAVLLSYSVRANTPVTFEIQSASSTSSGTGVAHVFLCCSSSAYPVFIPSFTPLGSRYRIVIKNPTARDQTVLEVEEVIHTDAVHVPQNLRACLVWNAPYSIFTDTVTKHSVYTDPQYFDRLLRLPWGGGKVAIYVQNTLNVDISLDILAGIWEP